MKKINFEGVVFKMSKQQMKMVVGGCYGIYANGSNCPSSNCSGDCYVNGYKGTCKSDSTVFDGACLCNG